MKSVMKMNKQQLYSELTEIIACKLYSVQQQCEGKYPTEYDPGGWRNKYLGIPAVPPPFIILNTFKPEVDMMVALIMNAIDRAEEDEPKRCPFCSRLLIECTDEPCVARSRNFII